MLTRLKVDGFKNLDGVDVRFGPFTCVAGANGVGKSNLFDAIAFLSALADRPLMDAARAVRGGRGDGRGLFYRSGDQIADRMTFLAEMLIPEEGEDELGQPARASMTFLRYELGLRYREDPSHPSTGTIEVERECMVHINRSEAGRRLGFPHKPVWRKSVVRGRRTSPYISTELDSAGPTIVLHGDSIGGGIPRRFPASRLSRTILSSANSAIRTLVVARQEMMRWRRFHLDPEALRKWDQFGGREAALAPDGSHLPATLLRIAQESGDPESVFAQVASRLWELAPGIRRIEVDVDDVRRLLSIVVVDKEGTRQDTEMLSDGTMRYLALAVMAADSNHRGLICLEEPENGIHPSPIPALVRLLRDLAMDVDEAVGPENPLNQVIINTHSPSVVSCVGDDTLLVARSMRGLRDGPGTRVAFQPLPGTWRDMGGSEAVARGDLLAYLNPQASLRRTVVGEPPSVIQRSDLQSLLPQDAS
jgi:predicted ATPase